MARMEALAAEYEAERDEAKRRVERLVRGHDADRARGELATWDAAARMLRAALTEDDAENSYPGQKSTTLPLADVLAWEGDYLNEPRAIPAMGPGLWMAVEVLYDYAANTVDVKAYPVTP